MPTGRLWSRRWLISTTTRPPYHGHKGNRNVDTEACTGKQEHEQLQEWHCVTGFVHAQNYYLLKYDESISSCLGVLLFDGRRVYGQQSNHSRPSRTRVRRWGQGDCQNVCRRVAARDHGNHKPCQPKDTHIRYSRIHRIARLGSRQRQGLGGAIVSIYFFGTTDALQMYRIAAILWLITSFTAWIALIMNKNRIVQAINDTEVTLQYMDSNQFCQAFPVAKGS